MSDFEANGTIFETKPIQHNLVQIATRSNFGLGEFVRRPAVQNTVIAVGLVAATACIGWNLYEISTAATNLYNTIHSGTNFPGMPGSYQPIPTSVPPLTPESAIN